MAHEIHEGHDAFGENRTAGQRAWHGIGKDIGEGLSATDGFLQIGIDWETHLAPLQCTMPDGSVQQIPEWNAHIRADNNFCLGLVSDGYKPFQNMELAELADSLAGADKAVTTETCGTLYKGRRVFALVKLPHEIRVGKSGEDLMKQYVLVSNGHGGTSPISIYPTSIRVVCANTLRWSERDMMKGIRFRHQGDFDSKVAQARLMLGTANAESVKFGEKVQALAATELTPGQRRYFMKASFEDIFGKGPKADANGVVDSEMQDRYEAKQKAIIEQWMTNLVNEKNTIDGIGGSAWAALNAITEYSDHQRGRFLGINESDARVAANLFGVAADEKKKVLRRALALIK